MWSEMTTDPFTPDSAPRWKRRSKLSASAQATQSPAPDCYSSPDWWRLRAAIMKALQDFPEARESVVTALRALNALEDSDGPAS